MCGALVGFLLVTARLLLVLVLVFFVFIFLPLSSLGYYYRHINFILVLKTTISFVLLLCLYLHNVILLSTQH